MPLDPVNYICEHALLFASVISTVAFTEVYINGPCYCSLLQCYIQDSKIIEITNKKSRMSIHVAIVLFPISHLHKIKTHTTVMLLGSTDYDNHSDESTDDDLAEVFDFDNQEKRKKSKSKCKSTLKNGKRIRHEAISMNKKEGDKKRRAKERSEKKRKQDDMFDSPTSKITNYTHASSTSSTSSASASKVPSSTTSSTTTSTTLCGYCINPIESPDPIDNGVYTQKDPDHVYRGCNSTASECPNKV